MGISPILIYKTLEPIVLATGHNHSVSVDYLPRKPWISRELTTHHLSTVLPGKRHILCAARLGGFIQNYSVTSCWPEYLTMQGFHDNFFCNRNRPPIVFVISPDLRCHSTHDTEKDMLINTARFQSKTQPSSNPVFPLVYHMHTRILDRLASVLPNPTAVSALNAPATLASLN